MRILWVGILIVSVILITGCSKTSENRSSMTISSFIGDVTIITEVNNANAVVGKKVFSGDTLKTGDESFAVLSFSTGNMIKIDANSTVKVSQFIESNNGDQTDLELQSGKVMTVVSKLKKDSSFQIKSNTCVAAVRGTTFILESSQKKSKITVLKGKVRFYPKHETEEYEDAGVTVTDRKAASIEIEDVAKAAQGKSSIETVPVSNEEYSAIKGDLKELAIPDAASEGVKSEVEDILREEVVTRKRPAVRKVIEKENSAAVEAEKVEREKKKIRERVSNIPNL